MFNNHTYIANQIVVFTAVISSCSCGEKSNPVTKNIIDSTRMHGIYPRDHKLTFKERKVLTNKFLIQKGIPILESLPDVVDYREASFRDQKEIASKCVVLYGLMYVANLKKPAKEIMGYFKKYDLWKYVSPKERVYLLAPARTKKDNINISWRIENLNVLLWALGQSDSLVYPNVECRISDYKNLPNLNGDPTEWINKAKIRSTEDILNETDLIYRIHWATEEASINGEHMPAGLNEDVVEERHFALNWLTMYEKLWDDITTDT